MRSRALISGIAALILAALNGSSAPALTNTTPLPPGFAATVYGSIDGALTSLTIGKDTRADAEPGSKRVYVTDLTGGRVLALDHLGATGGPPTVFAEGFSSPLGVVAGRRGRVFVADSRTYDGPWGTRAYGRVTRLRDTDGDGIADKRNIVVKDLPNGRHNTNGMAFGPDRLLYITNGNSTDDGIEGGEKEIRPWSGSLIRVDPRARNVSLADLPRRKTLVATGMRNVYDVAFSPVNRNLLFLPTNGIDDARKGSTGENPIDPNLEDSDDLLYATWINDRYPVPSDTSGPRRGPLILDDFGFPSCLYNIAEKGSLTPFQSPNPDVIDKFGRCPVRHVPRPVASFGLHPSSNGLAFQKRSAWGDEYRNDLFVAEWGNLFGPPAGHDVVHVELNRSGTRVTGQSRFFESATPLDVVFAPDGALLVGDFSGTIYRIDKVN